MLVRGKLPLLLSALGMRYEGSGGCGPANPGPPTKIMTTVSLSCSGDLAPSRWYLTFCWSRNDVGSSKEIVAEIIFALGEVPAEEIIGKTLVILSTIPMLFAMLHLDKMAWAKLCK